MREQVDRAAAPGAAPVVDTLTGMLDAFLARLPYLAAALGVYAVFHLLGVGLRRGIRRLAVRSRRNRNLGLVAGRLVQGSVWLVGLLVAAVQYDLGVGYGEDLERVKGLVLDVLHRAPGVLADPPPQVLVVDLAESAVNLRLLWWVEPPRRFETLTAQDEVLVRVKVALQEADVDMPFPTREVLLRKAAGGSATD